ncbi:hypothetical protein FI667_g4805, partial [Globisporangium splendens]
MERKEESLCVLHSGSDWRGYREKVMDWDGAEDSLDVWIEKFADMVHRQQGTTHARGRIGVWVNEVTCVLVWVIVWHLWKIPPDWGVNEEALKCMINSVYSRPEFVAQHFLSKAVNFGSLVDLVSGTDRSALILDLLKLIAVMIDDMKWTKESEDAKPEIYTIVHRLGELLLSTLRASHPKISRLDSGLLGIKNKAMEVFMCIPADLLTAFIETEQHHEKQRRNTNTDDEEESKDGNDLIPPVPILAVLLQHLQTMLLATPKPQITAFFKNAVFPRSSSGTSEPEQLNPVCTGFKDHDTAFYFKHLSFFLTCLDSNVRRYTGEWLYLLCGQNAKPGHHDFGTLSTEAL